MDVRFTVAGLVVGALVGLCGIGGSSLLAPILIVVLGVNPLLAVGTDLIYSVPTKLLAAAMHGRQGTVDRGIVALLLAGGAPGAAVGLVLVAYLRAHVAIGQLNTAIKHGIGYAILVACAATVATYVLSRRHTRLEAAIDASTPRPPKGALVAAGVAVGVLVSMTSIGSGSVTLPLLLFLMPGASLRRLIGSEIAFGALLIPIAALGHWSLGNVDWNASLSLLFGSLPGAALGSRLSALVKDVWLRPIIIVILGFAGSRLI